ncbi:hypothetical protein BPTFM16_00103 [Altererythrobacter insulae]|nr:hypothetical protein BPTFM16_00103 [Altererythrobacter insulae]
MSFRRAATALSLSLVSVWAPAAFAAPDGHVTYTVQENDTLYDLGQTYLLDPRQMREVRLDNQIRDPRLLQIGQKIEIPRRLLKFEPVELVLQSFSGPVNLEGPNGQLKVEIGQRLLEGQIITTDAKGFASIGGEDGALVTIPSNSRLQIVDARRYTINGKIDVRIKVLKGRGEIKAPSLDGEARFRVGTPIAVTAVRGTEFRVAYVEDDGLSLAEVVEGEVAVRRVDQSVVASEGEGVAARRVGDLATENLLPAPDLDEGGRIQTDALVEFAIEEVDDAAAYRTQLARDAGFIEIIDQALGTAATVTFADIEDGRYFVRSRGVAASGVEGFSKPYTFRRKRLGADAGAETSPIADAFKFGWRVNGRGQSYHAFQLWDNQNPSSLLVDEVALQDTAILIGDLPAGSYAWRVGTFQIDDGEPIKVWTPVQEFAVSE